MATVSGVKLLYWRFSALLMWLGVLCGSARADWHSQTWQIMGTRVSATIWHDKPEDAAQCLALVKSEFERLDQSLSPYIASSELSQVNAKAFAAELAISSELVRLIDRSLYYSRLSDGAFDITFASVGFRYDYRAHQRPSEAERQSLLAAVNFRHILLNPSQNTLRFKHPNTRIDLGGIAKGYAVDQAIVRLREYGIKHAAVSAGGDSRLLGDRFGKPWLIGIKNPRAKPGQVHERDVVLTLPLEDTAVSTSGDYERFFMDADTGERVHHILNPKTGKSADTVMSVTILGPAGIDTDALSTTVFVLGVVDGLKLIDKLPEFDAVIIDRRGKVHYSSGLVDPAQLEPKG